MPLPRTIRVMVLLLLALLASGITTTPAHGTLVRGPNEHVHATGTVDFSDQLILSGSYASALPRGLGLSTDGNVIGFTGHVFDAETGLLLARLRVHDAVVLGRWLSRDPAGFVDGMNLYVYVRGNPLVWWCRMPSRIVSRRYAMIRQGSLSHFHCALRVKRSGKT